MASSFSFAFSGDDIDRDEADDAIVDAPVQEAPCTSTLALKESQSHNFQQLLSESVPDSLSYNLLEIPVLRRKERIDAANVFLPRREVFDIRAQLMAESDLNFESTSEDADLLSDIAIGDITPTIYEGGFKTWECAIDLAEYLSENVASELFGPVDDPLIGESDVHFIELGAGTAIPTLRLLHHLFSQPTPASEQDPTTKPRKIHFTLADYNSDVLALATTPNILLTWARCTQHSSPAQSDTDLSIDTPALISSIIADLNRRNTTIDFISGAWSPDFVSLVQRGLDSTFSPNRSHAPKPLKTLILASETIYSPSTLPRFTETLLSLLRKAGESGPALALIAAKQIYFGVGGGVDEFRSLAEKQGADVSITWTTEAEDAVWEGGKRGGVGRVVLDVRLR